MDKIDLNKYKQKWRKRKLLKFNHAVRTSSQVSLEDYLKNYPVRPIGSDRMIGTS